MKFKKAFFPTLVILTLFVYSSYVSAQDLDPALMQQVVEVDQKGNPQIKKEYLQQRKERREDALENKETNKEYALEKRDAIKAEAEAKKEAYMERRLEAITDKLSSRISSIKTRLLNRTDTLQSIIVRIETNIDEHSGSFDSSAISSILNDLDIASDIIDQAVIKINALEVAGNYESLDDLKTEGMEIRDEIQSIVDDLKLAKNHIQKGLAGLKSAKRSIESTSNNLVQD